MLLYYEPINVKPHLPPLGQWMGEGGALTQILSRVCPMGGAFDSCIFRAISGKS